MLKHVPGPWEVCENPKNDNWYAGITIGAADPKDARRICDLANWHPETREANGRLIAAAPDLLEALIFLHDRSLNYADGRTHEELGLARTKAAGAIGKATGNDPF